MKLSEKNKTWLVVILVVVLLVIFFVVYISAPSVGKIKNNNSDISTTPTPIDIFSYDGEYFSFKYNDNYELRHNEIVDSSLIDQITLFGKRGYVNQIIAYRKSSVSNLDEVSAVQMRRQKKDQYTEEPITLDGVPALLFKATSGIEFTVISVFDNKVLTIGISANSNDIEKYLAELNRTIDTFKWSHL